MNIQIIVKSKDGAIKAQAEGAGQAILAWEGEYAEGDQIFFIVPETERHYLIRVDDTMDEDIVYLTKSMIVYEIPFGEKKSSYNPKAFTGIRHYLSLRLAEKYEVNCYRNLSKNGMDQHEDMGCYPHAWANVETRGEAVFAARNVIDGVMATQSHGRWPYQSWGINKQDDAQITIEFGRPVVIDRIVLYTRADFPHDNWWRKVTFTISDGTSVEWELQKGGEAQVIDFSARRTQWIRLEKLIQSEEPSPFPALTQIEVYGTDVLQ